MENNKMICIKPFDDFEVGDWITYRYYEHLLESYEERCWYSILEKIHIKTLDLLESISLNEYINDFSGGLDLEDYDYIIEAKTLNDFIDSFVDEIEWRANLRQKQIDSVLLPDFEDIVSKTFITAF